MRFRAKCVALVCLTMHLIAAAAAPAIEEHAPLNAREVSAAIEELRKDPNLGQDKSVKTLRWIDKKAASAAPQQAPNWIKGLFEFLNQAAGLLLWVAGGVAFALAAVWVYRTLKARHPPRAGAAGAPGSHINALDIRPASLPTDIPAAARALLAEGRARDALSLLYRGAVSRAVQNFSLTITESFTEGEVLKAAKSRLDAPRSLYFATLVGLWQRAVYANDLPPTDQVAALCTDFTAVLERAA